MKNILTYLFLIIVLFPLLISCQKDTNFDGHIYIVSRNSESKEGNLVLKYNQTDIKISHIGISFSKDPENAKVYNVSYDSKNKLNSALLLESLSEFWISPDPADNKMWELSLTETEYEKAKSYIKSLEAKEVFFDFATETELGMYCSEFVYGVLTHANLDKFKKQPLHKKMKGFERLLTNVDDLYYYPADFFLDYHPNAIFLPEVEYAKLSK